MPQRSGLKPAYVWSLALIVILASVVLFYQSWHHPFILDDVNKIENNPDVRSPRLSIKTLFYNYNELHAHTRNDPSRPVTFLIYWICWQVGNGSTVPFHILNSFIHAICALLVGLLVAKLPAHHLRSGSLFVAAASSSLLFLSFPLNAGTVIYMYGLSDLLSAMFALLILNRVSSPQPLGGKELVGIASLFVLSLGAKQSSVVIPAMALICNPRQRQTIMVLFILVGLYLVSRFLQFGRLGDLEAHDVYRFGDYFTSQGVMIFKYLKLIFWPLGFCVDHAIFPRHYSPSIRLLAWISIAALTIASVWAYCRSQRLLRILALGWLLWLISLLPTSSFFPTADLFVERRAYLATVGVALSVGGLVTQLQRRLFSAGLILVSLVIIFNSVLSWARIEVFGRKEKVWEEVLSLYPGDHRASLNLSTAYLEDRRWSEAKQLLEQIVRENPKHFQAWVNLGAIHQSDLSPYQNLELASIYYQKVLDLEPNNLNALSNAGYLMLTINNPQKAQKLFAHALAISPKSPQYHVGAGRAALMMGERERARGHFNDALYWDPNFKAAQLGIREINEAK